MNHPAKYVKFADIVDVINMKEDKTRLCANCTWNCDVGFMINYCINPVVQHWIMSESNTCKFHQFDEELEDNLKEKDYD